MKQVCSIIGMGIAMALFATPSLASGDHKHGDKPKKEAASHDKKHGSTMKDDKAKPAGAAKKDEHEHGKPTK